jgi:hypothetical protein
MSVRIMCAVCNKEIDELHISRSEERCVTRYKAKCHGEEDVCELDDSVGLETIVEAVAFGKKLL